MKNKFFDSEKNKTSSEAFIILTPTRTPSESELKSGFGDPRRSLFVRQSSYIFRALHGPKSLISQKNVFWRGCHGRTLCAGKLECLPKRDIQAFFPWKNWIKRHDLIVRLKLKTVNKSRMYLLQYFEISVGFGEWKCMLHKVFSRF